MTSRYALTILALAATALTACGRSTSGPGAANAVAQVEPDTLRTSVIAPPEAEPRAEETPTDRPDAGNEGASSVTREVDPVEPPHDEAAAPGPRPAPSSTTPPMTSVDPRQGAIEPDDAPATGETSPSPHVDLSFQDGPLFRDDDPLEISEIPVCRKLVMGLKACWPKVDEEVRKIMEPLVAAILNDARSLKRPFVRQRACEMGWDALPGMFESYCAGAFQLEEPKPE